MDVRGIYTYARSAVMNAGASVSSLGAWITKHKGGDLINVAYTAEMLKTLYLGMKQNPQATDSPMWGTAKTLVKNTGLLIAAMCSGNAVAMALATINLLEVVFTLSATVNLPIADIWKIYKATDDKTEAVAKVTDFVSAHVAKTMGNPNTEGTTDDVHSAQS